jgi:hypothetical protein
MNFRHAAALALVGWYLMLPPLHSAELKPLPDKSYLLDWKTPNRPPPLATWEIVGSYDSARECAEAMSTIRRGSSSPPLPLEWGMALCIATDDPRLKEK